MLCQRNTVVLCCMHVYEYLSAVCECGICFAPPLNEISSLDKDGSEVKWCAHMTVFRNHIHIHTNTGTIRITQTYTINPFALNTRYPSRLTFPVLRNMKPLNNRIRNDNNTSTSVWYIGWWRLYVRCLPSVISSQHKSSLSHSQFRHTYHWVSYTKIVEEIYCSASMLLLIHTNWE